MQIGSESTSLKIIKQRVEEICDDPVDSAVCVLGDIFDDDRPTTRAMKKATFADRPEVLSSSARDHLYWIDKEVIPLLLPLQKTKYGIVGVLAGHHYANLTHDLNSAEYFCNRLTELSDKKVPYLGVMSSFLDFRFRNVARRQTIRVVGHIQHGQGGGQTKGSTIAKLERTAQGFEADFYVRAHDCQLVATKTDRLYPQETHPGGVPQMMSQTIPMLNLGAATRGYELDKKTSYVEHEMMRPVTMGWGSIYMDIKKARDYEDRNNSYKMYYKVVI